MLRLFTEARCTGIFRKATQVARLCRAMLLLLPFVLQARAHADVGILLSDSTGLGMSRFTGAGHASVYLSNVCPASPVRLRLCRPGEQGSVLSNYTTLDEDKPYEWNAIPLSIFLYGVENPEDRPLYASSTIARLLQDNYRDKFLKDICTTEVCRTDPHAYWRDSVGTAFQRAIYLFAIHTTVQQDEKFIAEYNAQANVNHYNGFTNNCADFARRTINAYFPGAVRPNYLNDFGMTSPKAAARSFSHYAKRHPELRYYAMYFAQLPGNLPRSHTAREGTEAAFHQKKYLLPFLFLHGYELPICLASYALTGRFNPQQEVAQHASPQETGLQAAMQSARRQEDGQRVGQLKREIAAESYRSVGAKSEWDAYKARFQEYLDEAAEAGLWDRRKDPKHIFADLDRGTVSLDDEGAPWICVHRNGVPVYIGLTQRTLFAPGSNPNLAYAVMLARVESFLSGHRDRREPMSSFVMDWALLKQARQSAIPQWMAATKTSAPAERLASKNKQQSSTE